MHLVALGERNTVLVRKKFSRAQLVVYTANLASLLIGLEACAGAHFMGRCCEDKGTKCGSSLPVHQALPKVKQERLIDAEAIAEAVTKQNMRFVQIKTEEQLDVKAMHRVRHRLCSVAPHSSTRSAGSCWNGASPSQQTRNPISASSFK
jgi:transposase